MAPIPNIPPEIWMRTAEFIPSDILQNLYSVNPVFLHLALNDRYNNINLSECWTAQTSKHLKHLSLPHIAHRVQRLVLSSHWLGSNVVLGPSEKITLRTRLGSHLPFNLGRFIDPYIRRISNVKMCYTLMQNTVLNFPNVTSLIIVEGFYPTSQTQPDPLLLNTYTTCAPNLRSLTLWAYSPNFNVLFPPNASDLTSLEGVSFSFSPLDGCIADAESASTFFQAIASRLTSLKISLNCTSDEYLRMLPSSPRQRGGKLFPKLTNFHFEAPASPSPILIQFLNQHADTLKHLHLRQHMSQSLRLPVLPHLESLNVKGYCHEFASREGVDAARNNLQHSSSTLTSLDLTHCSFTLHDLSTLLDLLGREGEGLKSLTVTVQVLSPHLLDMLAEKLPQLERLKVDFDYLRSTDEGNRSCLGEEDIESFLLEMKKRSYPRWSLRSFGIESVCVSMKPDTALAILMPLTVCIPHLVDIDGRGVEMWRVGSTWNASECTRILLGLYNLSVVPAGF